MKTLLIALALAAGLSAQNQTVTTYTASKQTSLTAAAEVVTVQQPATGARPVQFVAAYFDCSVACSMTLERNGTAASATSLSINPVFSGSVAATSTAFSSSNVGTGTVLSRFNCAAACSNTLDLTDISFQAGGTAQNLTLRSSSITGTVTINFKFREVVSQ